MIRHRGQRIPSHRDRHLRFLHRRFAPERSGIPISHSYQWKISRSGRNRIAQGRRTCWLAPACGGRYGLRRWRRSRTSPRRGSSARCGRGRADMAQHLWRRYSTASACDVCLACQTKAAGKWVRPVGPICRGDQDDDASGRRRRGRKPMPPTGTSRARELVEAWSRRRPARGRFVGGRPFLRPCENVNDSLTDCPVASGHVRRSARERASLQTDLSGAGVGVPDRSFVDGTAALRSRDWLACAGMRVVLAMGTRHLPRRTVNIGRARYPVRCWVASGGRSRA